MKLEDILERKGEDTYTRHCYERLYMCKIFMGLRGDWKREKKERPTNNRTHTYDQHLSLYSSKLKRVGNWKNIRESKTCLA